jgi:endonuclease III
MFGSNFFPLNTWGISDIKMHLSRSKMEKDIVSIISKLKQMHGEPRCELNYSNSLELTVATVLSAQCTDERVNRVTRSLFERYRTWQDYINVSDEELEEAIRPTGFYKNKVKSIKGIAREISERFNNRIPEDIDAFVTVKGIGRKSASLIIGLTYKAPAVVVDTHVIKVAGRIGLTGSNDPNVIEKDLKKAIPEILWMDFSLLLVLHGRYVCKAKRPECERCLLQEDCDFWLKVKSVALN